MVWSKTEKAGQIVETDESIKDKQWLYFTDGSRINKTLVNEYMLIAPNMDEAISISKTLGGIPSNPQITQASNTNKPTQESEVKQIQETPNTKEHEEVNVMLEMLRRMSTKNVAHMDVAVNVPSTQVYEMLIDQMDVSSSDLEEHISMLIESQIDNLRSQLKEQIKDFIKNYYNNESGTKPRTS